MTQKQPNSSNFESGNGATVRRRVNPITRLFSSVWFGIILLTLILVYASIFSAIPRLRGTLELSEMHTFRHWLFVTLIVLFIITLSVTTWRRIRWNVTNLGVLTVHAGLILLVGGAAYYFGMKIEGDTQLFSPKIEILTLRNQQPDRLGHFLAADGEVWSGTDAKGSQRLQARVLETESTGIDPVTSVKLQFALNDAKKTVTLTEQKPAQQIAPGIFARFQPASRATKFYNKEFAALYVRENKTDDARQIATLRELPEFMERFVPGSVPIRDANGKPVESKRTRPTFGNSGISSAWFEHWDLPIEVTDESLPFDITITGYLPYVGRQLAPGFVAQTPPQDRNPVLRFEIRGDDCRALLNQTLFANNPKDALTATTLPIEFVWLKSRSAADELLAKPIGSHELRVQITDPPFDQRFPVRQGQEIAIPNTPYKLKVNAFQPRWTMTTPGFEGAQTPIAMVQVDNGEQSFMRTVVQRFPQLSQDIDAAGTRHRTPLDANIRLTYRSIETGWAYFLAGPDIPLTLAMISPNGDITMSEIEVGKEQEIELLAGRAVNVIVNEYEEFAEIVPVPVVIPVSHRRPGVGRQVSAIRVQLTDRAADSDWQQTRWMFYSDYPEIEPKPLVVRYPGSDRADPTDDREIELIYSRAEHDLGVVLAGEKLTARFQPGMNTADFWRSDFLAKHPDGDITKEHVETNVTATVGKWTYFQKAAPAEEQWQWTMLGVGNRRGIWPMVLGSILIPLGSMYAFYVKPWLIQRRKRRALALAAERVSSRATSAQSAETTESLVEVEA